MASNHMAKHTPGHSSEGRRIDDHKFWAGSKSNESVFPKGVHHKAESSADGAGSVMSYQDTTEKIHSQQEVAKNKAKSHHVKFGTRN